MDLCPWFGSPFTQRESVVIRQRFTTHSLIQLAASLEIGLANARSVERYLNEHPDLLRIVTQVLKESRQALSNTAMRLEMEGNYMEMGGRTLVLRIEQQGNAALSESVRAWNDRIAHVLSYSDAWFRVSLDTHGGAKLRA